MSSCASEAGSLFPPKSPRFQTLLDCNRQARISMTFLLFQEDQLARVLEKNTELTIKNTNLQKQVQQLQNVSEVHVNHKNLSHSCTYLNADSSLH